MLRPGAAITPLRRYALAALSIAALVAVRTIALQADPPRWLSWSGALRTDEGFYTLDARHLALYGTWARGNFHDRLLAPLLSTMQQGCFALWGTPSLAAARTLDAVLGLATVAVLWLSLRRACGPAAAGAAALLLGFAPPFVLYNRLALQETPTAFYLTVCFALWVWVRPAKHGEPEEAPPVPLRKGEQEQKKSGDTARARAQDKGALPFPPPPYEGGRGVTSLHANRNEGVTSLHANKSATASTLLLLLCGTAFAAALLCKALAIIFVPALCLMLIKSRRQSLWIVCGLALILLPWAVLWYAPHHAEIARMSAYYRAHQFLPHAPRSLWLNIRRAGGGDSAGILRGLLPYLLLFVPVPTLLALQRLRVAARKTDTEQALWLWIAGGVGFCMMSSYAPDRYYVLFLPPLCAVAGIAWAALAPAFQRAAALIACTINLFWLGLAWHERTYTAMHNAQIITRLLPARSIIIGDMAPALALGTTLDAAPVQPGLSNSVRPVETLHADYLAITRAPVYEHWWRARYPTLIQPAHHILSLPAGTSATVDIYKTHL